MKSKMLLLTLLFMTWKTAYAQIIGLYKSTEKSKLTISVKKDAEGEAVFRITAKNQITCKDMEPIDFDRRSHFASAETLTDKLFDEIASDKEDNSANFRMWVPRVCLERFMKDERDSTILLQDVDYVLRAASLFTNYIGRRSPAERFKKGEFKLGLCFQQAQQGDSEYRRECVEVPYSEITSEEKELYTWHQENRSPIP